MFPGEVLRQHGASGKAGSWRRAAVAQKADRLSESLRPLSRCAGGSTGESSASAGNFSKLFSRTRQAFQAACSQPRSSRRNEGRLEEPGTRHGGFFQKPNGTGCDEWGRPKRKGWSGGMEGGAGGETQFPITRPPSPARRAHHLKRKYELRQELRESAGHDSTPRGGTPLNLHSPPARPSPETLPRKGNFLCSPLPSRESRIPSGRTRRFESRPEAFAPTPWLWRPSAKQKGPWNPEAFLHQNHSIRLIRPFRGRRFRERRSLQSSLRRTRRRGRRRLRRPGPRFPHRSHRG